MALISNPAHFSDPLELPYLVADLCLPCLAGCKAAGDSNFLKASVPSSIGPLERYVLDFCCQGGGLFISGGTVTMDNCNIYSNSAEKVCSLLNRYVTFQRLQGLCAKGLLGQGFLLRRLDSRRHFQAHQPQMLRRRRRQEWRKVQVKSISHNCSLIVADCAADDAHGPRIRLHRRHSERPRGTGCIHALDHRYAATPHMPTHAHTLWSAQSPART